MASSASVLAGAAALLFTAVLSLLTSPVAARPGVPFHPCNTLLIYSFSASSTGDSDVDLPGRPTTFSVYRVIFPARSFPGSTDDSSSSSFPADLARPIRIRPAAILPRPAIKDFGVSSLQDRAKDILVVVVGLFFGVGCGALTAAAMYLFWSLVATRHEIFGSDASDDEEDAIESPKKAGYVKIPAADPAPVKEGYEKN